MNKLVDTLLEGLGMSRQDLCYRFMWKGRRYYIPPFNPLWWLVSIVSVVTLALVFYFFLVSCILIAPGV